MLLEVVGFTKKAKLSMKRETAGDLKSTIYYNIHVVSLKRSNIRNRRIPHSYPFPNVKKKNQLIINTFGFPNSPTVPYKFPKVSLQLTNFLSTLLTTDKHNYLSLKV